MVELRHTDLATEEDKAYGIDTWARLFKATTWEEIRMITKENPSMSSAAETIYLSNSDFNIRESCRRRIDAIAHEKHQNKMIEDLTRENQSLSNENQSLSDEVTRLRRLLADNNIRED